MPESSLDRVRSPHVRQELRGVVLLLAAVFLAVALVGPAALDTPAACVRDRGITGPVGACLRTWGRYVFGWPATILLPLVPLLHGLAVFGRGRGAGDRAGQWFLAGLVVLTPIAIGIVRSSAGQLDPLTGLWGGFTAYYLLEAFGVAGAWLTWCFAVSTLMVVTLAWNPVRVLVGPRPPSPVLPRAAGRSSLAAPLEPDPLEMPAVDLSLHRTPAEEADDPPVVASRGRGRTTRRDTAAMAEGAAGGSLDGSLAPPAAGSIPPAAHEDLPPADILTPSPPRNREAGDRELDVAGAKLIEALRTFRVDGTLVGRTTGPTVTQFEVEPAPGVKVRQFATLANDLALAMRAPSIRVVAPIPGRGAVGIEVPNPTPEMVSFREVLESREFQQARAALPIVLGRDLEGRPVIADLAKMPHLLIAGATGSGKSVCVNTIITSLVYRHTPRTLRFLMVDPKMVELSVYNTLPHLRHKVIVDNRDAAAVLKWAVLEMNERYELLAANGCRNIQDFNKRVQEAAPLVRPAHPEVAFEDVAYQGGVLPYLVVVIDEMADLMMTVQGEVETPIAMLAQKARAIGIHLILATQRPSVNVITGLIKANFPSRIAFRVASQVDSRTIIDGAGAEMLLGNGDMLFIPPGKSEPARLQGAYLSSDDTETLMSWYAAQREARRQAYEAQGLLLESPVEADVLDVVRQREAVETAAGGGSGEPETGARDRLFREAAEIVVQHQQGSTSLLQRKMNVGYGRAARIIDQLVEAGVLEAKGSTKGRDVLIGLEELDRICGPRD